MMMRSFNFVPFVIFLASWIEIVARGFTRLGMILFLVHVFVFLPGQILIVFFFFFFFRTSSRIIIK